MLNAYAISRLERLKFADRVRSLVTVSCNLACNDLRIEAGRGS